MSDKLIWTDKGRLLKSGRPVATDDYVATAYRRDCYISLTQDEGLVEVHIEHIPSLIKAIQKAVNEPKGVPENPARLELDDLVVRSVEDNRIKLVTNYANELGPKEQKALHKWLGEHLRWKEYYCKVRRAEEIKKSMEKLQTELDELEGE